MGRVLSPLIGPEERAARSNNSEGMGGEGGQESVVVPAPPPPFMLIHLLQGEPGSRALLGSPQNRKTSLISLLIHDILCLRFEAIHNGG